MTFNESIGRIPTKDSQTEYLRTIPSILRGDEVANVFQARKTKSAIGVLKIILAELMQSEKAVMTPAEALDHLRSYLNTHPKPKSASSILDFHWRITFTLASTKGRKKTHEKALGLVANFIDNHLLSKSFFEELKYANFHLQSCKEISKDRCIVAREELQAIRAGAAAKNRRTIKNGLRRRVIVTKK